MADKEHTDDNEILFSKGKSTLLQMKLFDHLDYILHCLFLQVKLLWEGPRNFGWKNKTAYRWKLLHRPEISLIRFRIFEGERLVADSPNIFDNHLKGGRLGVLCFSQAMSVWSDLVYRCNGESTSLFLPI